MRINPRSKAWVTYNLSVASLAAGDEKAALVSAKMYLERDPSEPYAYINLALALTTNSRGEEAPACILQMRERLGDMSIAEFIASHRFRDRSWLDQLVVWLRAAGLR